MIKKYHISSKNTLNYLLKHKENILHTGPEICAGEKKSINRKRKFEAVEKETLDYFNKCQLKGFPVSRSDLQQQGKGAAKKLNVDRFSSSNGWEDGFVRRYDLKGTVLHGTHVSMLNDNLAEFIFFS